VGIYQCEKCGCAENTALGWYHYTKDAGLEFEDKKLCSACGPSKFLDGSPTECGEWHGRFERRYFPLGSMETDKTGNLRKKK